MVREPAPVTAAQATGSPLRLHWSLDPTVTFLNHGSFGACPIPVLEAQSRLRTRLESEPVLFLARELEERLDAALAALGRLVGASSADLAFVPNATTGVNAVLRSLEFRPGDEILVTDHAYGACAGAADFVAKRTGARVVVARIPFPLAGEGEVIERVLRASGPRVRLAMLDHVTSPTALIWPIARLVRELAARGVDTLVDGAHAPGMLPLELDALGAAYYVGDCHKWLCAPKGVGFLYVRPDRQSAIAPTTISHGWFSRRDDRSRFRQLFDWTGTLDPTAALSVSTALDFMPSLVSEGWTGVMAANHALTIEARSVVCAELGIEPPAPDAMLGSMAAMPLGEPEAGTAEGRDPVQGSLWRKHRIEVPILAWGNPPQRILRLSAQLYNASDEYDRLARALRGRD